MHSKRYSSAVALAGISFMAATVSAAGGTAVPWEPWSDRPFARAAAEKRFVLLDVGAEWCHWCHVMDETTYREPEVLRLIRERFVAVRVDPTRSPTSRTATRTTAGRRRSSSTRRAARS